MYKKSTAQPGDKPKKPLNFYFRCRAERLEAQKGNANPLKGFRSEWRNIPEAVKEAERAKHKIEMDKYWAEMKLWKGDSLDEDKPNKREKKEAIDHDSDDGKRKGEKSRGRPKTKVAKQDDTEEESDEEAKEEKVEKVEKGKSKDKGNEKGKGKVEEKPKKDKK